MMALSNWALCCQSFPRSGGFIRVARRSKVSFHALHTAAIMSSVREAASGPPPPPNRYSQLAQPEQLAIWHNTFRMFDRDGGGDVDLREIGLMFRQLGQHPTEREMRLLIEEVDADGSGTVDFEEFCNLMLRQERSVRTPEWLADLLPADLDADDPLRLTLPNHVVLTEPKFEAARKIQNKMKGKKAALGLVTGGRATSPTTAPGFSGAPSKVQPFERGDLTRDQLMMVVDLLPSASHVTVASVAGHDDHFGPFIAAELAWRLATSSRTNLTSLDLSFDGIGDDGAVALARTLRENQQLLTLTSPATALASAAPLLSWVHYAWHRRVVSGRHCVYSPSMRIGSPTRCYPLYRHSFCSIISIRRCQRARCPS